eukprot:234999-Ditylum_brightwellii.AAC.1
MDSLQQEHHPPMDEKEKYQPPNMPSMPNNSTNMPSQRSRPHQSSIYTASTSIFYFAIEGTIKATHVNDNVTFTSPSLYFYSLTMEDRQQFHEIPEFMITPSFDTVYSDVESN